MKLDETGNLMISEGHFASETIRVRVAPGVGGGPSSVGWQRSADERLPYM